MSKTITLRKKIQNTVGVLALCGLMVGCSTSQQADGINDPLEGANRAVFGFNEVLDTWFLRPVATLYRGFVPPPAREGIHNLLSNLSTPVVLLNDILQGEDKRAETTLNRFFINSTLGILGLRDVATEMGHPKHSEDFGQTLAVWGVGEGPYVVLPILGPSNPRDTVGLVVDYFTDPINWWARNTDRDGLALTRTALEVVDTRSRFFDEIEDMKNNSLDYYAAVRSFYKQNRDNEIRNSSLQSSNSSPSLSFDFDAPSPSDEEITEAR